MKTYPVALKISGYQVLIVGGGRVALRKVRGLQDTGAHITVVAPVIKAEILPLVQQVEQREFQFRDLLDKDMVFCCTNSLQLNQRIARSANGDQLVNNTSAHEDSNFYNYAVLVEEELNILIGSEGHHIRATKALKEELKAYFQDKRR
ncbi:hypothetical protein FC83_GL000827 [Agrilactobacillus composti DSM 18527 = JCM 14202]|uniref:precorrin-2 dehydrogenase n=1 Tax=Agrilactobacillus composti DSM 18527 = JCM 14202 TaxID=1423734 RepID=X0PPR2_9LACO|nr:bifunctional precorrin-2 dehydrogenase/sirohydrochlorin ferrochelatase [Agrilactobacillus composti]KRM35800.1 hypothetical protein FC83_GL000827 [Agrilactobacillus composti DSM 18527 = JCM 14202]GAF39667.1 siroheme synthase [Agrilactobacillus composti DSM 18527 = JCM 14202]